MKLLEEKGRNRNPWASWQRYILGRWIERFWCSRKGHTWEQFYIKGDACRYDALHCTWLTCRRCALLMYANTEEWDAHNTPLHQAIRRVL